MTHSLLKIAIRTGLVTACAMLVYEASDQLLIYHYFKFEYYIAGAVIVALATGVVLTSKYYSTITAFTIQNPNPLDSLTTKELRVLELIALGKSNKEIAVLNYVEVSTVKTHINHIFFKLGLQNRAAAANLYRQRLQSAKSTLFPPNVI
jgi:DNA-binding CsgD family transcriptional regulator